jgi:prepilin-type N-terminal cleavage/methylation domain-containing protein
VVPRIDPKHPKEFRVTSNVHMRKEDGFSLVELLIVIVVLGILSGVVIFAVGSTRKDSIASSCKTNYKSIELSAEAVMSKTGTYPATTGGSDANQAGVNAKYASLLSSGTMGGVLREYPFPADYRLVYEQLSAGSNFQIRVLDKTGTPIPGASATEYTVQGCDAL